METSSVRSSSQKNQNFLSLFLYYCSAFFPLLILILLPFNWFAYPYFNYPYKPLQRIPFSPLLAIIVIWFMFWGIQKFITRGWKEAVNPLQTQILLLFAVFILSAFWQHEPLKMITPHILPWAVYILIFLMISEQAKNKTMRKLLTAVILFSGLIAAFGGIHDFIHYLSLHKGWFYRARYSFESPNLLADYLLLILPIPWLNFIFLKKTWAKWLWYILLIPFLTTFVMTLSRGAWIGFFAAFIFLVIQIKKEKKLLFAPLLPFLAAAVGIVLFLPKEALHRALILPFHEGFDAKLHIAVWESALKMIFHHPFLGIGFGNFTSIYPKYAVQGIGFHYLFMPSASNLYLQIGSENGLIGLGIFLWLIWSAAKISAQILKNTPSPEERILALALPAAFIGFLVHGFFDYTWWYLKVGILSWILAGISIGLYDQTGREIITSNSLQPNKSEEKPQSE